MANRTTFDPEKFNLNVARLKKGGFNFEIVIDADKAIAFKENSMSENKKENINISEVIKYEKVFADAQRGQLAPESTFNGVFETTDVKKICEIIVLKGDMHITAERRKEEAQRKKKQIISLLQRNGVDPRTDIPHTLVRIESAIEEAKVHIDEFKPAELQVKEIIKKLQPILPIKFEVKEIEVLVSPQHAHRAFGYIKNIGKVIKNEWGNDKSWFGVVQIPGGLEEEFHNELNKITHGTVHTKIKKIK